MYRLERAKKIADQEAEVALNHQTKEAYFQRRRKYLLMMILRSKIFQNPNRLVMIARKLDLKKLNFNSRNQLSGIHQKKMMKMKMNYSLFSIEHNQMKERGVEPLRHLILLSKLSKKLTEKNPHPWFLNWKLLKCQMN